MARGLYHRSGIRLLGKRHPAPKVFILLFVLYQSRLLCKCKIVAGQLCFFDALNRANTSTLRFIEMAFALHTGGGVDYVDGVAFCDGFCRALWQASAARNAIFVDFHCHGKILLCEILYKINPSPVQCQMTNVFALNNFVTKKTVHFNSERRLITKPPLYFGSSCQGA